MFSPYQLSPELQQYFNYQFTPDTTYINPQSATWSSPQAMTNPFAGLYAANDNSYSNLRSQFHLPAPSQNSGGTSLSDLLMSMMGQQQAPSGYGSGAPNPYASGKMNYSNPTTQWSNAGWGNTLQNVSSQMGQGMKSAINQWGSGPNILSLPSNVSSQWGGQMPTSGKAPA